MNYYLPNQQVNVLYGIIILCFIIILGFLFTKIKSLIVARIAGWCLVVLSILSVNILCQNNTPCFRMFGLIGALLYAMKTIVCIEEKFSKNVQLNFWQYILFVVAWFGMKPLPFLQIGQNKSLVGWDKLLVEGVLYSLAGIILLNFAKYIFVVSKMFGIIFALISFSVILHFGLLTVLAAAWRYFGIDCQKLFISPWKAKSLSEFWGQRWNLAFIQMITIGIYRPISKKFGRQTGVIMGFLCSGLLHEVALSLPVHSGYGLPTLYFLMQSALIKLEEILTTRFGILNNKVVSKLWLFICLLSFSMLLFHKHFINDLILPIL